MKPRNRRQAFTLVELLVVITIIGMLMALLLPAVNAAQEAARSNTCRNNMRQIAVGLNTFEATFNRFPGWNNTVGGGAASWSVEVLPYIDRLDVYDTWANNAGKNTPQLEIFICPSNPPEQQGKAETSMVLNSGHVTVENKARGIAHNYASTGVSTNKDAIVDADDGTLLVSENIQATLWSDVGRQNTTFMWHDAESTDRKINGNYKSTSISNDLARPSSYHSGGVNAAYVDVSTRFLRQDINYNTYKHLMTPDSKASGLTGTLSDADFK